MLLVELWTTSGIHAGFDVVKPSVPTGVRTGRTSERRSLVEPGTRSSPTCPSAEPVSTGTMYDLTRFAIRRPSGSNTSAITDALSVVASYA